MEIDIETRCQDYFYNLNPIAQKFSKDIENTREAYQNLWNTLSKEERNQVINENIITPAAVIKYAHIQVPVIQDTSSTYSWFTKSQLQLFTYFKPNEIFLENNASQLSHKMRDASKKLSIQTKKKEETEESKHSFLGRFQTHKPSILKPKAPPPPPPTPKALNSSVFDQNSPWEKNEVNMDTNEIPKTGFDFLDNW